jgi:hypothetical protein
MAWKGWEDFDPAAHERAVREQGNPEKKPAKYRNKRTKVDGLVFDSKREADYWMFLRGLQEKHEIHDLRRQVSYDLTALSRTAPEEGGFQTIGRYIADFTFKDGIGRLHIVDAKGVRTALYRWKKKHFEIEYDMKIEEV